MPLRKLLLATYQFPPIGGSGVQRAAKLAHYLPAAGWRAHVVSAGHTHYPLLDPMLADGPGEAVSVHRTCGLEPAAVATSICRHFRQHGRAPDWLNALEDRIYWRLDRVCGRLPLPETEMLWVPAAIRQARRLIDRHQVEAVVTTGPPHSTHLVGMALKRRLGLPWIADFRDPILDNFAYRPKTRLADRFWQWLERTVVRSADRVIVTCPELTDSLLGRYDDLNAEHFTTITNGFDPGDRPEAGAALGARDAQKRRFAISYVGAFYREQTIRPILEAIRGLLAARRDIAADLAFRLVGSLSRSQRQFLRGDDAAFFVDIGYRPHDQAIQEMTRADVLLLATPANEGGRLCIPAKVFEYLAFGGHVIALVHQGTAIARILAEAGNVTLVHRRDPADLARALERCYDAWRRGSLDTPRDYTSLEPYRRDRLAARFAEVVEDCANGSAVFRPARDDTGSGEAAA